MFAWDRTPVCNRLVSQFLLCVYELKNTITHLIMVGFQPFQRSSLVYFRFASVGPRDVVGGATKEANARGVPSEIHVHENLCCR